MRLQLDCRERWVKWCSSEVVIGSEWVTEGESWTDRGLNAARMRG